MLLEGNARGGLFNNSRISRTSLQDSKSLPRLHSRRTSRDFPQRKYREMPIDRCCFGFEHSRMLCECPPIRAHFLVRRHRLVLVVFNLYLKGRRTFSDGEAMPRTHLRTWPRVVAAFSRECVRSGSMSLQ